MRITADLLRNHGACEEQVEIFTRHWPDGVIPNARTVVKAQLLGLDIWWCTRLLSDAAQMEYKKIRTAAFAKYKKIWVPVWAEYEKVMHAAWTMKYQNVMDTALAEYEKIRAVALAKYVKVMDPALIEYEKAKVDALLVALRAQPEKRRKPWRANNNGTCWRSTLISTYR